MYYNVHRSNEALREEIGDDALVLRIPELRDYDRQVTLVTYSVPVGTPALIHLVGETCELLNAEVSWMTEGCTIWREKTPEELLLSALDLVRRDWTSENGKLIQAVPESARCKECHTAYHGHHFGNPREGCACPCSVREEIQHDGSTS